MKFPIAERELRVAARQPKTYRGRLISGAVFGLITVWLLWAMRYMGLDSTAAAQTFNFITYMASMSCMFQINVTADAISSEKRAGTLGLLFLTDLKGRDIIFGKLAALGVATVYGLLAIIPMISIPVLLGGIPGESQARTAVSLVNTVFFSLSMGLWVSAMSWEQKSAANKGGWIAAMFVWGIPGIATLLEVKYRLVTVAHALQMMTPFYQQQMGGPFAVGLSTNHFWYSFAITHALAWLALWRACQIVPHAWQDRPVLEKTGKWRDKVQEFKFGAVKMRSAFRRRLLDLNAVHWLSSREKSGPFWVWFFMGLVMTAWVGMWLWLNFALNPTPFWGIGIPAVVIMQIGLWMRTSAVSSEVLARDRFSGALELLLSTSLTVREVARGQFLTVRRLILWPAVTTIVIGGWLLWVGLGIAKDDQEKFNGVLAFVGMNAVFVALICSAYWTGMWMACITRLANGAPGLAMLRLLVAPIIGFCATLTTAAALRIKFEDEFVATFLTWFLWTFGNSIYWSMRSRKRFYAHLRLAASERYQPPPPRRRWFKFGNRKAPLEMNLSRAPI